MLYTTKLRVARPTDNLEAITRFYREGLGLTELYRFEGHDGFDGVMFGLPGAPYHLEFTHARGHRVGRAPTADHLLVFYLPDKSEWRAAITRLTALGYTPVPSFNPYWDKDGRTRDPRRDRPFAQIPIFPFYSVIYSGARAPGAIRICHLI